MQILIALIVQMRYLLRFTAEENALGWLAGKIIMLRRAPLKLSNKTMLPSKISMKVRKSMKSKQLAVTVQDKIYWNRLATEIGCIACAKDGRKNMNVSIHHVDGRTKPGCHSLVLPLCAQHHQQDDSDPYDRVAVHPNKSTFELLYGSQYTLIDECNDILGEK